MSQPGRIAGFDSLRGFAILGVLVIHVLVHTVTYSGVTVVYQALYGAFCLVGRLGVPAFLLISGFFLTRSELQGRFGKELIHGRMRRVFFPYLIWSTVYFLLTYPYLFGPSPSGRPTILIFAEKLLLGNVTWHLYFIVLLLQYYLLAAFGLGRRGEIGRLTLVVLIGAQLLFILLCYLGAFYDWSGYPLMHQGLYYFQAYRLSFFPVYAGYFVLGRWLGARYPETIATCRSYRGLLLGICIVASIGVAFETTWLQGCNDDGVILPEDWMVSTNIFILGGLALVLSTFNDAQGVTGLGLLTRLATPSFALYLLHEPMMGYWTDFLHRFWAVVPFWQLWLPFAAIVVTVACCLLVYKAGVTLLPTRWSRLLFG